MAGIREKPRTFFRLSPVELSEASCFGVTRGEICGRIDPNFWRLTPIFRERFSCPRYPVVPLGSVVALVQYGCSSLATEEPVGLPMIRMNNLQNDGWDLRDLKYIAMTEGEAARYRLEAGDLLFNRTNSKELVGKCEVFTELGTWVFASYLIRVRLNTDKVLPQFASDFLNTRSGRLQINRLSRQIIGMTNINAEELKEILLPVPLDLREQRKLVADMDEARAQRRAKLAESDALLASLDDLLLRAAGLTLPRPPKTVFGIHKGDLVGMLNPDRYRAMQLEKHLGFRSTVRDVGDFLDARCSPEKDGPKELWDWIRIDDLPNQPWQVDSMRTELGEDIKGAFFEVQENDILVARLGPTILNAKFVLCPKLSRRTVASSEFLVLRCHPNWQPAAALWMLRTKLYRDIMYLRSRGGTPSRFRLDADDLAAIPFPALGEHAQTAITSEVRRCHEKSHRLRAEAEADWQSAKRWFEEQLLGAP
jgi:hypothetical protein